jgi:hypothetical protein
MAVSIDTYDQQSGIHPRNKQLVSKRLATAGLNIAYGKNEFPINGPFPKSVQFSSTEIGILAEIVYDQKIAFEVKEFGGFYFCCQADYLNCDDTNSWKPVTTLNFLNFNFLYNFNYFYVLYSFLNIIEVLKKCIIHVLTQKIVHNYIIETNQDPPGLLKVTF